MPEEVLIFGSLLLVALVSVWACFQVGRIRQRRKWRSKRPIHIKVRND